MIIFEAEKSVEGLAEKVLANTSVAYTTEIQPWSVEDNKAIFDAFASLHKSFFSKASLTDADLYTTKSILVSTLWNKNDDVFNKMNVWAARHTPVHKRTNIEHDEKRIVGHMTECWAVDNNGDIIPDNQSVDLLPDLYHLVNGAVIYTSWDDKEFEKSVGELIESIKAGERFVSMEAVFTDFDYAVITPEKQYHTVARNSETSFLTKHLRIYGGTGEFDGCKLGRVLKNITFSGKGYVETPANPFSVLFNNDIDFSFTTASTKNPFQKQSGVFIFCSGNLNHNESEINRMDNSELLTKQNEEYKKELAQLREEVKQFSKASVEEKYNAYESQLSELKIKLENLTTAKTEVESKLAEATKANETLQANVKTLEESNAMMKEEAEKMKKDKVKADRVSRLVSAGYKKDDAEQKVEAFMSLDDSQFDVVASELVEAKKMQGEKDKEEDMSSKSSEEDPTSDPSGEASASANSEVETEEPSDPNMSTSASENNKQLDLRRELGKAIASRLGFQNMTNGD